MNYKPSPHSNCKPRVDTPPPHLVFQSRNGTHEPSPRCPGCRDGRCLLGAALHHLRQEGDAVQVDELLGERDVPGEAGQVLQGLQLGVHARRLDALVELLGVLSLIGGQRQRGACSQRGPGLTPHSDISFPEGQVKGALPPSGHGR